MTFLGEPTGPSADLDLSGAVAELWLELQPVVLERLTLLEGAAGCLLDGRLNAAGLDRAQAAAHQLAGSLGMFDRGEAGDVAAELESLLRQPEPHTPSVMRCADQLRRLLGP